MYITTIADSYVQINYSLSLKKKKKKKKDYYNEYNLKTSFDNNLFSLGSMIFKLFECYLIGTSQYVVCNGHDITSNCDFHKDLSFDHYSLSSMPNILVVLQSFSLHYSKKYILLREYLMIMIAYCIKQ